VSANAGITNFDDWRWLAPALRERSHLCCGIAETDQVAAATSEGAATPDRNSLAELVLTSSSLATVQAERLAAGVMLLLW
jgi:hypothetical protein